MTPHLRFKRNPHLTYKMTPHLRFIRTPYKSVFLTHFMALIYLTPDNMTTHLTFNRTPHRSLFNASHATRRTDGASLLCPLELSLRRFNKRSQKRITETSWKHSTNTLLGVLFETYLPRRCDTQKEVATTLSRLDAAWG